MQTCLVQIAAYTPKLKTCIPKSPYHCEYHFELHSTLFGMAHIDCWILPVSTCTRFVRASKQNSIDQDSNNIFAADHTNLIRKSITNGKSGKGKKEIFFGLHLVSLGLAFHGLLFLLAHLRQSRSQFKLVRIKSSNSRLIVTVSFNRIVISLLNLKLKRMQIGFGKIEFRKKSTNFPINKCSIV